MSPVSLREAQQELCTKYDAEFCPASPETKQSSMVTSQWPPIIA